VLIGIPSAVRFADYIYPAERPLSSELLGYCHSSAERGLGNFPQPIGRYLFAMLFDYDNAT